MHIYNLAIQVFILQKYKLIDIKYKTIKITTLLLVRFKQLIRTLNMHAKYRYH